MPVRDARKTRRRILITLLAILMWVAAADVVWVRWNRRIPLGHDTTRVTLPLVDGQPDYLGALNEAHAAGMMWEENAAPVIYEIMGLREDSFSLYQKEMAFIWGLPLTDKKPLFVEYGDWARGRGMLPPAPADRSPQELLAGMGLGDPFHEEVRACLKGPWKAEEHPSVLEWLEALEPAMRKLDEACARPRFYWPTLGLDGRRHGLASPQIVVLPKAISSLPALAEAVIVHANQRLASSDHVAYEHDVVLVMQLARLLSQQPTFQEYLIALAIDNMAGEALQRAAASQLDSLTAELLRKRVDTLPALQPPGVIIDEGERFQVLSGLCLYLQASTRQPAYSFVPVDYSRALRSLNRQFDAMLEAMTLATAPERIQAMEHLGNEYEAQGVMQGGKLERMMHLESAYLMTAGVNAATLPRHVTENEVNRDLAQVALLLRAAKSRNGMFPQALEELKVAIPPDRFADKPLKYVRMGTGYMLYSVGPDMGDDSGTPRAAAERGVGWDMVLRVEK